MLLHLPTLRSMSYMKDFNYGERGASIFQR